MWIVTSTRRGGKWYWSVGGWTQEKDFAQQFRSEFLALVMAATVSGNAESFD